MRKSYTETVAFLKCFPGLWDTIGIILFSSLWSDHISDSVISSYLESKASKI